MRFALLASLAMLAAGCATDTYEARSASARAVAPTSEVGAAAAPVAPPAPVVDVTSDVFDHTIHVVAGSSHGCSQSSESSWLDADVRLESTPERVGRLSIDGTYDRRLSSVGSDPWRESRAVSLAFEGPVHLSEDTLTFDFESWSLVCERGEVEVESRGRTRANAVWSCEMESAYNAPSELSGLSDHAIPFAPGLIVTVDDMLGARFERR